MLKKCMLPVLTLALMLVMAITAFAEGWAQEGSDWVYYDANNNKVRNEWRKGADDKWRYLGQNGAMLTSTIVDYQYYVDSEGIMAANVWKQITDSQGTYWYYFLESGKMVTDGWKEINGNRYFFDTDGKMMTGWVDDDKYYCDSDGHMVTGWKQLPDSRDKDTDCPSGTDGASTHWYYLGSSGKKVEPTDGNFIEKRIENNRFCFDVNGAMVTGWVNTTGDENISGYKYYNTDGSLRTGWYSLYPPEELADNYQNAVEWFYFSSNGSVAYDEDGIFTEKDIKRINSKRYLFNKYGTPVYGLIKVYTDEAQSDWNTYYFGTAAQSSAQKGQMSITEEDGTKSTFYFADSCAGITGIKNHYMYYKGKLVKAEVGSRVQTFKLNGNVYLVNQQGQLQRSATKIKDGDGTIWASNSAGIVTKEDDKTSNFSITGEFPDIEFPDLD